MAHAAAALLAAVLSYPLVERLNAISGDVLIAASRDGPFAASARRLAGLSGPVGSLAPARKPGDDGPAAPS